jgi:hypothetical protein
MVAAWLGMRVTELVDLELDDYAEAIAAFRLAHKDG